MNIDVAKLKTAKTTDVQMCEETMTVYHAARWLALIEGVDFIDKTAKRMKVDLNEGNRWVKPLAFQKYINERTYGMCAEIFAREECTEQCTTSSDKE
jgi:hypothetical protein